MLKKCHCQLKVKDAMRFNNMKRAQPVLAQNCDEAVYVHDQIGDEVRQW